jgi:hydrogenase expression/formation protein HypD
MTPPLQFRDPVRGEALVRRLARAVEATGATPERPVSVMHVCGSHEQAIARYGLRSRFPAALDVRMGPGCPVCVTDAPEIDAAVALARAGLHVLTYGDMLRVPGTEASLDDARAAGARVEVIYAATQAVAAARESARPVVFFATGFETTAVATAALLRAAPPPNLQVLSAHKWVPAAMEVVADNPNSRIGGYLAAGHAATITGWGVFEGFVARHGKPVVVAGFEPLDILAGLCVLVEQIAQGRTEVVNAFPRCVGRDGNTRALAALNDVFETDAGEWRGIAHVPAGNLRLRAAYAAHDAALTFADRLAAAAEPTPRADAADCVCGAIMTGQACPTDCALYGRACRPDTPVGACMVSTEGACRIWYEARA